MAGITALPCEVVTSILRNLDNVRCLLPFLLTCRHVYASFKENPTLVADVLQRQVTPGLVPYAVAVFESSRLDPHTPTAVSDLLDTLYTERSNLTGRLQAMPPRLLAQMGRMHDVIDGLTTEFASSAWTRLGNEEHLHLPHNLSLSPTEYFRFCHAFYRAELYTNLFGSKTQGPPGEYYTIRKERFFLKHAPWENEQLGCAYDFLELKFAKASRDFLAHDVCSGAARVDYLTTGDNHWRQLPLSHGVTFIHRLSNEASYDGRAALLDFRTSNYMRGVLFYPLYDAIATSLGARPWDDIPPDHLNQEYHRFKTLVSQDSNCDGPFNALQVRSGRRGPWVMLVRNSWARERAYVLWDMDRLERHRMLEVIKNSSADSELQRAEGDLGSMHESFRKRSVILEQGGRGYWSKGDTSRIVWSKPPEEE